MSDIRFEGRYVIEATLVCVTGLRIGGTQEGFEIGGMDNPVVKDPIDGVPYIPGSSLKGKMRSLLEWAHNLVDFASDRPGRPHSCGRRACDVCAVFGVGAAESRESYRETDKFIGPTRLVIRDAFPAEETMSRWKKYLGEGTFTEVKMENTINRITSESNPRSMERVPAGSRFVVNMVLDRYTGDATKRLRALLEAMRLLEDSALGGSGSRGSGQVRFEGIKVKFRSPPFYRGETAEKQFTIGSPGAPTQLISNFAQIFGDEENGG